jgi:hypothetical protein
LELRNLVADAEFAEVLARMRKRCDELRDVYGGEYSLELIPTVQSLREKEKAAAESR